MLIYHAGDGAHAAHGADAGDTTGTADGADATATLTAGRPVERSHFYWEFHEGGFAQAVRQGPWKLVKQRPKFGYELFNLDQDASERKDLSAQHPDIAARLRQLMDASRTPHPDFPV